MSKESFEYTKALYELLKNAEEKKSVLESLKNADSLIQGDLLKFFIHPEIDKDRKKDLLNKLFDKSVFRDFLCVLVDNSRINILGEIVEDFEDFILNENKNVEVKVYSKSELTQAYLEELKDKLLKDLDGSSINLINIIDESITGGIRIEYGSNVIDGTLNTKFNNLIKALKE